MADDIKHTLAPKLRFPGFQKPWSNDSLSTSLREHKLKNAGGRDVFSVSMESGIVNQIEHLGRSFAASNTAHYNLGRRFDVVYTKSPLKAFPFGIVKQCKFEGEVSLSPLYGVFTPANPHVGLMIEAYFESPSRSKAFLSPLCQKGAKNTIQITNTTFLTGRLPLPTEVAEQQQVAGCLTSVDEMIAVQGRKVEALKAHKKGLMQQVFPLEGETVPRLRFAEFRDAPEWEERSLRSTCECIVDGTHFSPKTKNGARPYLTSKNIRDGRIDLSNISYISEEEHRQIYARCPVKKYDVLLTKDGANTGNCAINTLDYEFSLLSSVAVLRGSASRVTQSFLYQTIASEPTQSTITSSMSGQAITRITLEKLGGYVVPLPQLPEQQRIADCLGSLDAQIAAEAEKLAVLKNHKKGLMQQLFPSQEGM